MESVPRLSAVLAVLLAVVGRHSLGWSIDAASPSLHHRLEVDCRVDPLNRHADSVLAWHHHTDGPGNLLRLQRPPGLGGAFDQGNCSKAQALVRVEPIPFEIAVELGVTVVEQEPALWWDDFEHLRRFLRLDLLLGGSPKCTSDLLHDRPHGSSVHPARDAKNDEPVTSGWSRRRRCRGRALRCARIYDDRARVDLV